MRLAGSILLGAGIVTSLGSIAYVIYSMIAAFNTLHESSGGASAPTLSIGTSLSVMTAGIVLIIVGIILLAAWNRSSRY